MISDTHLSDVVLFIFAHQDDEVAVIPKIKEQLALNKHVAFFYLTHGGPARDEETAGLLESIGCKRENIYSVGTEMSIPDGSLYQHLEPAYTRLNEIILEKKWAVKNIYSLCWEGGHQDHDAVFLISYKLSRSLGILDHFYQFSLYNGCGTKGPLFKVLNLLPQNGAIQKSNLSYRNAFLILSSMLHFKTQWKTWMAIAPFIFLKLLFYPKEAFQQNLSFTLNKPHKGPLYYERRFGVSWEKFYSVASRFTL